MKKILIVSYFFPPLGGAGVQRVLKFIKFLPEFNYKPVILTVDHRFMRFIKDYSQLDEIPADSIIYRTPILDINWVFKILYGLKLHKLVRLISEYIIFPDYQRQWLLFAKIYIKKIIKNENIELVYISSPPHSIQSLGLWIKKKYNIPFVADFRDPLTFNPLNEFTKLYSRLFNFEKNILDTADHIIANTPINKSTYIEKFGISNTKIELITNGFDNEDFLSMMKKKSKKIIFSYIGRLYGEYNAVPFLIALKQIKNHLGNTEIRFIGGISESDQKLIKKFNLSPFITLIPSCSHKEAINYGQDSDYLVVILADNRFLNFIPGKTFEYIRAGRPILAIVPEQGSCASIIRQTNTGVVVPPDNIDKISETLTAMINNHGSFPFSPNQDQIQIYDRRNLTKKLVSVFDIILNTSTHS